MPITEKDLEKLAKEDNERVESLTTQLKNIQAKLKQAESDRDNSHSLLWRFRHRRNIE